MSSMLEKSLDEIIGSKPRQNRPNRKNTRVGKPRHQGRTRQPQSTTRGNLNEIRVSNLDTALTEQDIANLFNKVGETKSVDLKINTHGVSTGIAFVEYYNPKDAAEAITAFHRRNAVGRTINVTSTASIFDRIGGDVKSNKKKTKKPQKPKREAVKPKSAEDLDKELSMYMEAEGATNTIDQQTEQPMELPSEQPMEQVHEANEQVATSNDPFPVVNEVDMQ